MYINKDDPQFQRLIKMTEEEYDKYMCETYPVIFRERILPMSQTCMCWGFNISKGWYYILDQTCQKLQEIFNKTGIQTTFGQIKEKFGTARFYHDVDSSKSTTTNKDELKLWWNIIDDIISDAENATVHTCAECGEYHDHEKIQIGAWVYDVCEDCLVKLHPEYAKDIEKLQKLNGFKENLEWILPKLTLEEHAAIEKIVQDAQDRIEDASNKN